MFQNWHGGEWVVFIIGVVFALAMGVLCGWKLYDSINYRVGHKKNDYMYHVNRHRLIGALGFVVVFSLVLGACQHITATFAGDSVRYNERIAADLAVDGFKPEDILEFDRSEKKVFVQVGGCRGEFHFAEENGHFYLKQRVVNAFFNADRHINRQELEKSCQELGGKTN